MSVNRNLGREQGDGCGTARFAEIVQGKTGTLAGVHRSVSLKVGKRKVASTVSAKGGSQQREKRCVLGEGQNLAVAKGPSDRREVERKYPYFCYERIGHLVYSLKLVLAWEYSR
jgi:hypothetical protein